MPQQLSGLDSMFLYSENSRMPLEVSSLHIYDPSTAPQGKVRFKEILATIDARLEDAGIFHRKIREVPLSLDHPYWVEDENFDIEYHVRHIALPKPGDWRQLMIQVSRLQSREIDKTRPLWEAYVIEGLDNIKRLPKGCFAVFMKMHHATVDGVSGAALQAAIHDLKPLRPTPANAPPPYREPAESTPGTAELLARSAINNVRKSARLLAGVARAVPRLIEARRETTDADRYPVPATALNRGPVTANRVVDGRRFSLGDIRAIAKSQPDAKINDAVLAVVSGALRRYLKAHEDLPNETLIASCPVNIRAEASADADNMISMMSIPLQSHIDDPVERFKAIIAGSRRTKELNEILGADTLTVIPMNMPAFLARGLMPPLMHLAARFDAISYNTMVSNVAGIQKPLYFCGAKMVSMYGLGPVVDRAGLFHAAFSYNGDMTITFTACREMLPDPEVYADCLQKSFEEMRAATRKKPRARKKPGRRKSSKSNV